MPIRIVRLGTPRARDEGTRIGTVRRPPRGVPKEQFAAQDWYDVWYPNLSPSPETVKLAQAAQTIDGDQVIQLHGEAAPEWFAPLSDWDFKNSCAFH